MGLEVLQVKTNYEAERCRDLVSTLMQTSGDINELQKIFACEAMDGPEQYLRVLSTATFAFWFSVWPEVLKILAVNDIDHESLLRILELRRQTVAGDA